MATIGGFLSKRPGMSYPEYTVTAKESRSETLGDIIREATIKNEHEVVNNPKHYTSHPSGVECIQITEHMNFCLGNAIKYIWRAGLKKEDPIEDLRKARFYIEREITRLGGSL